MHFENIETVLRWLRERLNYRYRFFPAGLHTDPLEAIGVSITCRARRFPLGRFYHDIGPGIPPRLYGA